MRDNTRSARRVSLEGKRGLTVGEERLIDLLRGGLGAAAFTIVVQRQGDGDFLVSQSDSRQPVVPLLGSGETFEEAWHAAGLFSQPPVSCNSIALTLDGAMLRGLDVWIAGQPAPAPTREEAASHAIREWLVGLGLLERRPSDFH